MLGYWTAAFYRPVDSIDYDTNHGSSADAVKTTEVDARGRKRHRRSIFFSGPDSDSDDDDDNGNIRTAGALAHAKGEAYQLKLAVVPATPFAANPLCKGSYALTPSFPRLSSSPSLGTTSAFVAVHEEPNSGFRNYMEDRSAAMTADGVAYLGIFDGHGGIDASTFLQRHLLRNIQANLQPGCDVHDALTAAYSTTNAAFRQTGSIQGSTATTIILKNRCLIAANVGDSPAFVVKRSGEVYSVIQEHKIEGEEAARIAAQGVPIYRSPTGPTYMGTPDGTRWLNMSRAFGDFVYPAISCEPHVCSLDVSDGRYLVMGSDGLTEKWPVAEAAQYLTELAAAGWSLSAICRSLVERSLERGSTDNISCMIVDLEAYMMHADVAEPDEEAAAGVRNGDDAGCKSAEDVQKQDQVTSPPLSPRNDDVGLGPLGLAPLLRDENAGLMVMHRYCLSGTSGVRGPREEQAFPTPPSGRGRLQACDAADSEGIDQLICNETPGEYQRLDVPRCMVTHCPRLQLIPLLAAVSSDSGGRSAIMASSSSDGVAVVFTNAGNRDMEVPLAQHAALHSAREPAPSPDVSPKAAAKEDTIESQPGSGAADTHVRADPGFGCHHGVRCEASNITGCEGARQLEGCVLDTMSDQPVDFNAPDCIGPRISVIEQGGHEA